MFVVKNLHFPPWMVKSCEIHHGIHKLVGGIQPTPLKNHGVRQFCQDDIPY